MTKDFPTLYRKTSSEEIQFWRIWVKKKGKFAIIYTKYGLVKTDSPQMTHDSIRSGKNLGKKNETSTFLQAKKEAHAKWLTKKKQGYVENKQDALKGRLDEVIIGGVLPMLASNFDFYGHKIVYPCLSQPKLDGHRCIAIVKNGKVSLWTRTRKPYTSVPHIVKELEDVLQGQTITLDGELYNHSIPRKVWKKAGFEGRFEYLGHLVRQKQPHKDHGKVQYHIFDTISNEPQSQRLYWLEGLRKILSSSKNIFIVKSLVVRTRTSITKRLRFFTKKEGYEGIMLRNMDGKYKSSSTRSYDLQKVKKMRDADFKVVGVEEGRGKLVGHVGSFICETKSGIQFNAKMKGKQEFLRNCFLNPRLWKGKTLTVQFQELTGKGVPRFPVALRFVD